jgi:hypothetical protein
MLSCTIAKVVWPGEGVMKLGTISAIVGAALLAALATKPAAAASILIDHGATTLDPSSGLEWLDLTATAGQSFNAVSGGFGGYIAAGWQFATSAQVSQLFVHAGATGTYPEISNSPTPNATYETTTILLGLLGATQPNTAGGGITGGASTGMAGDGFASFRPVITFVGEFTPFGPNYTGLILLGGSFIDASNVDPTIGSYLVRTAAVTPIPAALPLFLTALAGIGFLARRARRQA